ncbi:MAG: S8 family serine peptidase [Candidatus Heimdallarchaeota archaeon]|nr:MAG: S8 family serine peptidase [Candidatus Heimdallarchaeota archaeon]
MRNLQLVLISLLCITVILPFDIMPHQTSNETGIQDFQIFPQNIVQDSSSIKLLFSYHPSEKNTITRDLTQFNPSKIHYYRNFPVGYVTYSSKILHQIKKIHPKLFSRLHISREIKVLPSIEQFQSQIKSEQQISGYIPPSEIINATRLWNHGIDGTNVTIAIIDSGISSNLPNHDFSGRIVYEESFIENEEDPQDFHGHGTHVAGIAAGAGLYKGIAYNANLLNLKAADMAGQSTQDVMLAAIDEAIHQEVDVISISIGFGRSSPWGSGDELTLAVDKAVDAGIVVVVAAGNEGSDDKLASIGSPASSKKVITVGATNGSSNVASYSSRGPSYDYKVDPDVVAPGTQIYAPLAPEGVLELAYESIVGVELGDYISLSGTSMATPVVSGAVALLKHQYPQITPSAIRAALQETAVDLQESQYTQGSGLINVGMASTILEQSEQIGGFDLISSLPKARSDKPIEFAERITFPGDQTQIKLSFLTGIGGTISWNISDSIKKFIIFNSTNHVQSTAGYFEKYLNISIPLDSIPGNYQGSLDYTFLDTTYSIPISLTITNPKSKLYWDTFYTGKDDSAFFNYRELDEFMVSNLKFDMNQYETALTWQNMSQNDILVLTDLEYPISERELNYISKFHNQNGSILLITSVFPYFNPDPYSRVVKTLGIPLDFFDRLDLVDYVDDGRNRDPIPLDPEKEIIWEIGNPFFEKVDLMPFKQGTAFKVDQDASNLKYQAWIDNQSNLVAAAYEPVSKGKVLILGSEYWFSSSFLSTNDGQNFTKNVFNWLKPETGLVVNSQITPSHQLEISAYYSDQSPLSIVLSFSNGSSPLENSFLYNTTLQHHRLVVDLGENQNQRISVSIKNGTMILKEFDIFDIVILPEVKDIQIDFSASSNVLIPSWAEEDSYDSIIDQGINFTLTHSESSSVQSILLISSQFEDTLEVIIPPLKAMKEIILETELLNNSGTQQTLSWSIPENYSTGYYSFDIQVWSKIRSNDSILLKIERGSFFIPDPVPSLDVRSTIGGNPLSYYREIELVSDIPTWNPGDTIELRLIGQDDNSDEFIMHLQFIHLYFWYADRTVLDHFEIPQSSTNSSENIGTFTVPTNPIPIPDFEGYQLEINNQLFVLLIFVRDTQGNYDIEIVFFLVSTSINIDPIFLLIFGVLAVAIISGAAILIRKRTSYRTSPYSVMETYPTRYYPSTSERTPEVRKFCHNCGVVIIPGAKFCSMCGGQI